eukprot:CAMPEP_0194765842 /NCGR_PEP_ID=MMETSP0323_2-20130528/27282_1 /TAXON_ID=2866 ORGANISM="Crypthecodinium cohnii, Strain Seligo" /NCGR_SAMPLE_ID=MMETSP0323_2 /ASSEMBLY_ACC=CAM_ASM_000346 /LENGTH=35 /DNA_ID= /DNA_START= /DNA_END= /DNA_ORIENTATION=
MMGGGRARGEAATHSMAIQDKSGSFAAASSPVHNK